MAMLNSVLSTIPATELEKIPAQMKNFLRTSMGKVFPMN